MHTCKRLNGTLHVVYTIPIVTLHHVIFVYPYACVCWYRLDLYGRSRMKLTEAESHLLTRLEMLLLSSLASVLLGMAVITSISRHNTASPSHPDGFVHMYTLHIGWRFGCATLFSYLCEKHSGNMCSHVVAWCATSSASHTIDYAHVASLLHPDTYTRHGTEYPPAGCAM